MVTPLCNRNCEYCCNKQYDLNDIPVITDNELKNAHTLLLTGGEPFAYTNPSAIAKYYKSRYPNIKNVYVYGNAVEFEKFINQFYGVNNMLKGIDGVSISIKNIADLYSFMSIVRNTFVSTLNSNRLYVFKNLVPRDIGNFDIIHREWQEEFKPANDSIFRRLL